LLVGVSLCCTCVQRARGYSVKAGHGKMPGRCPAAMQHLGVLEAAGLVRSEKVGRVRTCAIEPQALSQAEHCINARRVEWEHRLDRLGE
jgi:hypothetical protein